MIKHTTGAIAYRESQASDWNPGSPSALLVRGWPGHIHMWNTLLDALADAGYRAVAPDLPGYSDSPANPPGSWERPALVMHDWRVMIGLRWACDHPGLLKRRHQRR